MQVPHLGTDSRARARDAWVMTAVRASLRLAGEARQKGAPTGPAVAAKGFRPFFLLAGGFAASIVPLWILTLLGVFRPGTYLDATHWHAHEMVFGFVAAVLAGFLLTAVANWTERETLVGLPLLALSGLWVAGRLALVLSAYVPRWVPATADLAFLPVLFVVLARPLLAARSRRNFVLLAVVGALCLANVSVHLDVLGVLPGWRRRGCLVGVDIVVLVLLLIAGRIFPMFTRNATKIASIRSHPRLDACTGASMALLVVLDAAIDSPAITAAVAGVTAVLAVARSVHWGARHSAGQPLLWVLHVGYAWIPLGLGLRAAGAFLEWMPASVATHALTVGAIGTLTLGMMSRVTLGHTGLSLVPRAGATLSFAAMTLAALVRVGGPLFGAATYRATVYAAGALWTVAFAAFVLVHARTLLSPRADGKPG